MFLAQFQPTFYRIAIHLCNSKLLANGNEKDCAKNDSLGIIHSTHFSPNYYFQINTGIQLNKR